MSTTSGATLRFCQPRRYRRPLPLTTTFAGWNCDGAEDDAKESTAGDVFHALNSSAIGEETACHGEWKDVAAIEARLEEGWWSARESGPFRFGSSRYAFDDLREGVNCNREVKRRNLGLDEVS